MPGLGVFFVFRAPAPLAGLAAARLGAAGLERVFWPIQGLLGGPRRGPESLLARPGGLRGAFWGSLARLALRRRPWSPKCAPLGPPRRPSRIVFSNTFGLLGVLIQGAFSGAFWGPSWPQVGPKLGPRRLGERSWSEFRRVLKTSSKSMSLKDAFGGQLGANLGSTWGQLGRPGGHVGLLRGPWGRVRNRVSRRLRPPGLIWTKLGANLGPIWGYKMSLLGAILGRHCAPLCQAGGP